VAFGFVAGPDGSSTGCSPMQTPAITADDARRQGWLVPPDAGECNFLVTSLIHTDVTNSERPRMGLPLCRCGKWRGSSGSALPRSTRSAPGGSYRTSGCSMRSGSRRATWRRSWRVGERRHAEVKEGQGKPHVGGPVLALHWDLGHGARAGRDPETAPWRDDRAARWVQPTRAGDDIAPPSGTGAADSGDGS
jgi:hypothetical protein